MNNEPIRIKLLLLLLALCLVTTLFSSCRSVTVLPRDSTELVVTNAVVTNAVVTNAVVTNAVVTNAIVTNAIVTNAIVTNAIVTNAIVVVTNAVVSCGAAKKTESSAGEKWFELVKIALDKGMFAGGLALLGWLISKSLERFKSDVAFTQAVTEKKLEALAKIWREIHITKRHADKMLNAAGEYWRLKSAGAAPAQILEAQRKDASARRRGGHQQRKLQKCLDENAFWAGEKDREQIDAFLYQYIDAIQATVGNQPLAVELHREMLQRSLKRIDDIFNDLLEGRKMPKKHWWWRRL